MEPEPIPTFSYQTHHLQAMASPFSLDGGVEMPLRDWNWRVWHHRRLPLAVQSAAPIAAGDGPEIQSRRRFARGVRKALVPAAENGLRGWDTEPKPIETLASGTCRLVWPITMSGPSRILVSDHERLLFRSPCERMKMTKWVTRH